MQAKIFDIWCLFIDVYMMFILMFFKIENFVLYFFLIKIYFYEKIFWCYYFTFNPIEKFVCMYLYINNQKLRKCRQQKYINVYRQCIVFSGICTIYKRALLMNYLYLLRVCVYIYTWKGPRQKLLQGGPQFIVTPLLVTHNAK